MKKILVGLLALSLFGCATAYQQDRDCHNRVVESKPMQDKNISAVYVVDFDKSITSFIFENKTDKVLKIIWDESVFVDQNGLSNPVFTGNMKIADRGGAVLPTVLQPKGKTEVLVLPKGNVNWGSDGWQYSAMCGRTVTWIGKKDLTGCLDKDFSYTIAYELDGKKSNVRTSFRVKEELKKECTVTNK